MYVVDFYAKQMRIMNNAFVFFILDTKKTKGNVELQIKKTQAKVQHLMDSRVSLID